MSVLFKVIYNQIEDKEKTRVKSEMEIREIKVKSEKETRKAKAVECCENIILTHPAGRPLQPLAR